MMQSKRPPFDMADGLDNPDGVGMRIVKAWDRFWFSKADPLPLGVIRIFTGLVLLYVHLIYSLDLLALVGKHGWLDLETMNHVRLKTEYYDMPYDWSAYSTEVHGRGMPIWSVFFHVTDPGWIVTIHIGFLVAMALFTLGFCTRLTAAITWVAIISYIQRLPVFLYGMDTIMNILVIYLMIGPSGATLSIDRLIQRWWARRHGRELEDPAPSVAANFALRLMQVHFCFIYMASGLSKLQGAAWWTGTAVWGTMANYSFAPMNWPGYVDFLRFIAENRFLWELLMCLGSYGTIALELSLPYLIWRPKLRWLMICGSAMLHTGIGVIMGLTTFSLFMLCLLLAFVPAATHHAFVDLVIRKRLPLSAYVKGSSPTQAAPLPEMVGKT